MEFRWNDWNLEHLARHGVRPEEAEAIVNGASRPYPEWRGDGKRLVIGRGAGDRFLQVIFLIDENGPLFVIHARPLTDSEKRRFRRRLGL